MVPTQYLMQPLCSPDAQGLMLPLCSPDAQGLMQPFLATESLLHFVATMLMQFLATSLMQTLGFACPRIATMRQNHPLQVGG